MGKVLPMKSPLLACPFCGNRDLRFGIEGEHIEEGYEVRCECGAEYWARTKELAIAGWNNRNNSKQKTYLFCKECWSYTCEHTSYKK